MGPTLPPLCATVSLESYMMHTTSASGVATDTADASCATGSPLLRCLRLCTTSSSPAHTRARSGAPSTFTPPAPLSPTSLPSPLTSSWPSIRCASFLGSLPCALALLAACSSAAWHPSSRPVCIAPSWKDASTTAAILLSSARTRPTQWPAPSASSGLTPAPPLLWPSSRRMRFTLTTAPGCLIPPPLRSGLTAGPASSRPRR